MGQGRDKIDYTDMKSAKASSNTPAEQSGLFRSLAAFSCIAILATRTPSFGDIAPPYILAILSILLYLLATTIAQRQYGELENPPRLLTFLGQFDAFLLGCFVVFIDYSLLPLAVIFTMIQYNALSQGGVGRWIRDNLAFLAGLVLISIFKLPAWHIEIDQPINSAVVVIFIVYFAAYGYFSHRRAAEARRSIAELERQQFQLKLRNYQLSKYVSPNLRQVIEKNRSSKLVTRRKRLVVFFSDIVGFSEIADEMDEASLTVVINNYLTEMSKIALEHGGTIDKYIGDSIMIFFGDPETRGPKEDCIACISMALAMRRKAVELQSKWQKDGLFKPLRVRMGVSTGFCTVGNFGTETRLDYTLLGSEVNLASRLESAAQPGEILISQATHELVRDVVMCQDRGSVEVKGFKHPIRVFAVIDFRKNLGKDQSYFEVTTDGFSLFLDADKVPNYDRGKVLAALKNAAKNISTREPTS
ncbi:MAG TPA: hypothetical protein DCZ13_12275 [Porticoccaceae bacterium]|nr:hypothetical protein [Porticoccaceae bacterium]